MTMSDPIADMLTRIRNATRNKAKRVEIKNTKVCRGVAEVLKTEGYINDYTVVEDSTGQGLIHLDLKYRPRGEILIHEIKRASKPGRRLYTKVNAIPRPLQGMGISVVSTSRGKATRRVSHPMPMARVVLAMASRFNHLARVPAGGASPREKTRALAASRRAARRRKLPRMIP